MRRESQEKEADVVGRSRELNEAQHAIGRLEMEVKKESDRVRMEEQRKRDMEATIRDTEEQAKKQETQLQQCVAACALRVHWPFFPSIGMCPSVSLLLLLLAGLRVKRIGCAQRSCRWSATICS